MIDSPLLAEIVDRLIVGHPLRYAFLAVALLQAFVVPQLLMGVAYRPPLSVMVSALMWSVLAVVDSGLVGQPAEEIRDVVLSLWIASTLMGMWASVAMVFYLRCVFASVRREREAMGLSQ